MYYLQEKKLLTGYYRRFRDGSGQDPNGLKSLEAVIAPQALDEFEKRWRQWVLELRMQ